MAYETLGRGALEYFPCRYGKSRLQFRGPRRRLEGDYIAVLGGTETYGKFLVHPYPARLEERLGLKTVNFGLLNAGVDVFSHDATVLAAACEARATVIQITGAHNMSNRFYAVHPRRNDRFLRASTFLKTVYPEIDFTEFNFTRHLLKALHRTSPERFDLVEQELKESWVARMKTLVSRITAPVILLWLADHKPEQAARDPGARADPLFIDREMLAEVRPFASDLVEAVASPAEVRAGLGGLVYSELEAPAAREMLGSIVHEKAAHALARALPAHLE